MSDDILSQNEIDSLMSSDGLGGSDADGGEFEGGGEERQTKNYDALSQAFGVFNDSAKNVIETLVNKSISLEVMESKKADAAAVAGAFGEPALAVEIPFGAGLAGTMYLLITRKMTAALSDLMMMGDGNAEYVDEHKDAISEILNQVMGAFNTAFGGKVNESISCGTMKVVEYDPGNPPVVPDTCDMVQLKAAVQEGPEGNMVVLVSDELSTQLMSKMASAVGEDDGGVGLNMDELDELSSATTGFGEGDMRPDGMAASFGKGGDRQIDVLMDVELDVSIELGGTSLPIKRILELAPGSIVELDRMAGEPVDLLVNNKVVAKGEVVVVDESFGIRIVSLVSPEERINSLR